MNNKPKPFISVVIPALNESATIPLVINKIKKSLSALELDWEIIIVDSDSTDDTAEISRSLGAKVVNQPLRGYGNAYHKGLKASVGDIIIIGDADDTYDFLEITKFIPPLLDGSYDFVIGSRLSGNKIAGAMPTLHRYVGTPILTFCINLLFGTKITDSNCGLRAFTREALNRINVKSPGWEYASEQIIKVGIEKLRVLEIPITLHPDKLGRKPHLNPWKAGWENIILIFMYSPKWLFIYPGLLFFIMGLFLFITFFFFPNENIHLAKFGLGDHSVILSTFFMLIGYQVMWFGTLAHFYTRVHRFEKMDNFSRIILESKYFTIEFNALVGILLSLAGVSIISYVVTKWVLGNMGDPRSLRLTLQGGALLAIGVLNVFNGFLINLLIKEFKYRHNTTT